MVKRPDGTALRVVRNGKGRSRLDRWRSSPLPDGSVDEINIRDLTDVLSKSDASSIQVTVQTLDGFYDVALDSDCVMRRAGKESADVASSLSRIFFKTYAEGRRRVEKYFLSRRQVL